MPESDKNAYVYEVVRQGFSFDDRPDGQILTRHVALVYVKRCASPTRGKHVEGSGRDAEHALLNAFDKAEIWARKDMLGLPTEDDS